MIHFFRSLSAFRSRFLALFLLAGPFALGQSSTPGSSACELRHGTETSGRGSQSGFEPHLSGPFADTTVESQLLSAYRSLPLRPTGKTLADNLRATLALARSRSNRCGEALAAYAIGVLLQNSDVAASRDWFLQAESAFRDVNSVTGLAHTHFELAALSTPEKSAAVSATNFSAAGDELERIGDSLDALSARIEAVDLSSPEAPARLDQLISQARSLHSPSLEARVEQIQGDTFFNRGKYDLAMQHYRRSDELYLGCHCDPDQRAYVQTSMGRLERTQGRPEAAIPHYRLALSLQNLAHDQSFVPQTLNAISVAYEVMKDYPRAIAYVQQALAIARAIHSQPFINFLEANLGFLYYQAGDPRRGLPLLERATANLSNDYQRCTRYSQLAELYRALGDLPRAETTITQSIAACERDINTRSLADSLETRARIRLLRGDSLDAALADAQRSLALIEEIRSHLVPEDAHKRGYNEASIQIYETTIAILARLNRYAEALEVTEQSRARAFLDLLSGSHTMLSDSASAPDANGISTNSASTSGPSLQPSTTGLFLDSESHVPAMRTSEILSAASRLHTTMLAFWLASEPEPRLYTWVINPSAQGKPAIFGTSQSIRPSKLEFLIRSTNPSFTPTATTDTARRGNQAAPSTKNTELYAWHRLYQILIAPVASHLPTDTGSLLTIVPHGPLFQLSFAALLDSNNHYLVERYALNTIPATGLLRYTQKNDVTADAVAPHYVLVANPQQLPQIHGAPLPPLPGTAAEVAAIANTLPSGQVTLLEGPRASAADLVRTLPQATVLHFATHAIVSGTNPFGSFLALNRTAREQPTSQDPAPDGLLTTASIYSLRLHTRLVVLSACRTGLGPVSADGVAGLSRAFFYAGSASVLTTLWDVADQPTAVLMPLFYQNLARGQARAQALRSAQRDVIARLRAGRLRVPIGGSMAPLPEKPAYWAAFSLSGEP